MVIGNRLLDAKSEAQLVEDFNRTLGIIDTLAGIVADIQDSALYKITFDSDGGSSVPNQYVVEGEKVEEPTDPTKTAYTFEVWMNGTTEYDFDDEVTSHLNLKATWTPTEYTISYTLDGGNLAEGVTNPTTYTIETPTFTLNNPTKEGYTFLGWTGSNGDEKEVEVSITLGTYGNLSYTANWQEVQEVQGGE